MGIIGHNDIRRVESFDSFEVLAHPLPNRDDRVFHRGDSETSRVSITYGSHDVQIARPTGIGSKGRSPSSCGMDVVFMFLSSMTAPCRSPVRSSSFRSASNMRWPIRFSSRPTNAPAAPERRKRSVGPMRSWTAAFANAAGEAGTMSISQPRMRRRLSFGGDLLPEETG